MSKLLKVSIQRLPFNLPFIYQYVDDLILSVPRGTSEEILSIFNSFNCHIQFTVEEEKENSVPFLDTKVIREGSTIILDWYQKPTSSGRYINFHSYHSFKMKTNVIMGLKKRILDICHPSKVKNALKRLCDQMMDNGYPRQLLHRLLYSAPNSPRNLEEAPDRAVQEAPAPAFGSFPYIENLSHKFIKLFRDHNIKIAQYNLLTNQCFFRNKKDKDSKLLMSNVVYQIKCTGCQSCYIGQTSQAVKQRISIHKSDARLRPGRCALASHVNSTGHVMDFNNAEILAVENNVKKRLFLEMCFINETDGCFNNRSDIQNLSKSYSYLLQLDKERFATLLHSDRGQNTGSSTF